MVSFAARQASASGSRRAFQMAIETAGSSTWSQKADKGAS
jgi:hypothetical protein